MGFDADVFVANINRNVITADMDCYVGAMAQGATMLLSGFYVEEMCIRDRCREESAHQAPNRQEYNIFWRHCPLLRGRQ